VAHLEAKDPEGDVVFGNSQGAVVISRYKAAHPEGTGNTFVLVENPSRPNGGILERFAGLYIPILDISLSGATPDNGDTTIDVARQYDGWADFPTYPLNLLATANAIAGMILVHGQTQTELTAAQIEAAKAGGSAYLPSARRHNVLPHPYTLGAVADAAQGHRARPDSGHHRPGPADVHRDGLQPHRLQQADEGAVAPRDRPATQPAHGHRSAEDRYPGPRRGEQYGRDNRAERNCCYAEGQLAEEGRQRQQRHLGKGGSTCHDLQLCRHSLQC
jgi:hypothetical protein